MCFFCPALEEEEEDEERGGSVDVEALLFGSAKEPSNRELEERIELVGIGPLLLVVVLH